MNKPVKISHHAKLRFLQRVSPDVSKSLSFRQKLKFAEKVIKEIWNEAGYAYDNDKGVVFYNKAYKACICVRNQVITTIRKGGIK